MASTGPRRRDASLLQTLETLVLHPSEPGSLELKIWLSLRRNPGQTILELSSHIGRHRKAVARAVVRLTEQNLLREYRPTSSRRDPSTGRLIPARYQAVDPSCS